MTQHFASAGSDPRLLSYLQPGAADMAANILAPHARTEDLPGRIGGLGFGFGARLEALFDWMEARA